MAEASCKFLVNRMSKIDCDLCNTVCITSVYPELFL